MKGMITFKKYQQQEEFIKQLKVSWKTVIKYRDSGSLLIPSGDTGIFLEINIFWRLSQ